jgi:hypothetical protein
MGTVWELTSTNVPWVPIMHGVIVDLVMGFSAVVIAASLASFSAPLADLMQEGDEHYREQHPWVESYEPQVRWLATDSGRWWILRGWLLFFATGFAVVGGALLARVIF